MSESGLKKNMVFNVILTLSQTIIPLITFPYISRILLPEGTGTYDFLNSFISYFAMFAMLGIPTYGIKLCASVRDDRMALSKNIQEILIINAVSSAVSITVLIGCMIFIDKINNDIAVAVLIAIGLFSQIFGMNWLCSALEQYAFISIKNAAFSLMNLILIFIFVRGKEDLIIYTAIIALSLFFSNVTNILYLKKYFSFRRTGRYNFKRHIVPILIFFAFTVASTIYSNIDKVMIGFMLDNNSVGLYSVSSKIQHLIVTVIISVNAVLLPRLSYYIEKGKFEDFISIIQKAVNTALMLAIPSVIFFMFYADDLILFFLKEEYMGSIPSMIILMPTIIFVSMTNLIGVQYLVPLGKEKFVMFGAIIGAVTDVVLNFILISQIGIEGAAIGTLCAEISIFIYQFIIIGKNRICFLKGINLKSVVFLILTIPVLAILKAYLNFSHFVNLLIGVSCFAFLYVLALILSKNALVSEVRLIFKKIFGKRQS